MGIVRLGASESALRRGQTLTLTCRNAFCKSPVMAMGLKRPLTSTLQSLFCRGRPVCKQSFSDGAPLKARADASYTIRSFVDSAVVLRAGLCGM